MNFTEQILYSLMAKTGKNSSEWLPLLQHLQDTADIMSCLCDEFLSPSFAKACGLEEDEFRKLAIFLAAVHDIGKATVIFQYKIGKIYLKEDRHWNQLALYSLTTMLRKMQLKLLML